MPRLRILAGPSPDAAVPISHLVNSGKPHAISSELFEGKVAVYIKGLTDADGEVVDSEYFGREDRHGVTWSIQVQGRFLQRHSADDIMFGNTFDRPLKLPWGSSAALKFMKFIDPTIEHDLSSTTQPWALSPLISTMPNLIHSRIDSIHPLSAFPPSRSISDDVSQLHLALIDEHDSVDSASSSNSSLSSFGSSGSGKNNCNGIVQKSKEGKKKKERKARLDMPSGRRSYFHTAKHRNQVVFGPNDIITTDFCYGFLEFSPTLSLRLPGGVSFDLMKYWDGQAVRFVCCERKAAGAGTNGDGAAWGRTFWCVIIELEDDGL